MITRTFSRWLTSVVFATLSLVTINLLVATSPVQSRPAASLINCSGSIQACIDAANDGDTILIAAGRYTESLTLSKPVSLTGENRDTTIIHAMADQRVLTVTGATISNSVVISGLTFTGGESAYPGGGMLLANSAQPLIRNSAFISNSAVCCGGGLYASSAVTLVDVAFINNRSTVNNLGGGGLFANGNIAISDTVFIGNRSYGGGGLIQWSSVDPVYIYRSRFERNDAYYGGGLAAFGTDVTLIDTEFISNTSPGGGGAFIGAANLVLEGGRFEGNNCSHGLSGCNSTSYGGGLFVSSTVTVTGTAFINNSTAYQGGAIDFYGGGGRLINTLFARNSAPMGAALSFESPGNTVILHSMFVNPTATTESAITVLSGTLDVTNTIIASHTLAISNTGGMVYEDYNLFFGNITNTLGVITDGGHSLIGDPKFVDPINGDYHLQFGSAAIDRGADAGVYTDLDGNVRPHGAGFDIGAYEFMNDTRYVATTGDDASNVCLEQAAPCATVQHAVDVAADGDEVRIASGIYSDLSVRPRADVTTTGVVTQIVYLSKTVTLRGGYTTTNWLVSDPANNPTVLNPQAQGRVIYVTGNVSPTIEGLRLTNGNPHTAMDWSTCTGWWDCEIVGAAVYAWQANLTLNESQIDNNLYGRFDGGSIYINGGHANLTHNTVMSNVNGGGIALANSTGVISGSLIVSNSVNGDGGGVLIKYGSGTLINNSIISNTADYVCGGGVCISHGSAVLENNIIRGNSILNGRGGGVNAFSSAAILQNNQIEENRAGDVLYIDGGGVSVEFNSNAKLVSNIIRHNFATASGAKGGGIHIYADSQATLTGNVIEDNASTRGAGISVERHSSVKLTNNLFANNPSTEEVYVSGSAVSLVHNTISGSGHGGIYVIDYQGPPLPQAFSTLAITNTIFDNQSIGIQVTQGNTVTLDSVLWHATPITVAQIGTATIATQHNVYGDPQFTDPLSGDYHLQFGSAAIDRGIDAGVYTDLDGNPRPSGLGFDIGACEFVQGSPSGNRYVATTGVDAGNSCTNSGLPCATLQHAIDVANDGEQVFIASGLYTQSATLDKPVSVTGANSATTIIHASAGQRVLTVTGATISNSVVISGLTFTGGNASIGGGVYSDVPLMVMSSRLMSNTAPGGFGLYSRGSLLTLIDTDFIANVGGGAYAAYAVQVTGGQFMANTGTALRSDFGGSLDISGTQFIGNSSVGLASGVESFGSSDIVNARFENNTGGQAGGLYFHTTLPSNVEALVLSNTVFISNTGNTSGGAIVEYGGFAVINCTFERNRSTTNIWGSGALYSLYTRMRMSGGKVLSNTATNYGIGVGGVVVVGHAHISDSLFENNIARDGGALYVEGSNTYLTNTQVVSNAAIGDQRMGGGVVAAGSAYLNGGRFERNSVQGYGGGLNAFRLVMSGTIFISNTARYGGGGASVDLSPIAITGGRFEGNRTLESFGGGGHGGGGLLAQYGSQLSIFGTQFINNVTAGKGGGLYTQGPSRLDNVLFAGNSADTDAAAIYFGQSTQRDLLHLTIADTISNPRAAISVLSGTLNLSNTIIASHTIAISNTGGIVYEDYNLFFNTVTNTVGVITDGGRSLIGDPKFVDPLNGDYHLQFGSAAIDRGVDAGVYTDLDGNPRPHGAGFDIGVYEFMGGHHLWLPLIRK